MPPTGKEPETQAHAMTRIGNRTHTQSFGTGDKTLPQLSHTDQGRAPGLNREL